MAPADWTIAIDGGFVRGVSQGELRNFEILTGRLVAANTKPYVFECGPIRVLRGQADGL